VDTFKVEILVDRVEVRINQYNGTYPGTYHRVLSGTPVTVRGGRHVIAEVVDYENRHPEPDEDNNIFGTQYVWEPAVIPLDTAVMRPEPPYPTADWERVITGEVLYANCDGIRTPVFPYSPGNEGWWGGVAIMPGEYSDVDMQLHDLSTGARDGFDEVLASSRWTNTQSDFLLMNFNNTVTRQYDVGLTMGNIHKVEDYELVVTNSVWGGVDPDGVVGTYDMGTDELLKLIEIRIDRPGLYHAHLGIGDPGMDLGFSLYGPDAVHVGKEDVYDVEAAAWMEPAGTSEAFDFFVVAPTQTGYFCVAVWKVEHYTMFESGSFTLTIDHEPCTAVPEDVLPKVTALGSVSPNPFNPRTTVAFELADAGRVRIAIYDVTGARVRSLLNGEEAPGSHTVIWDGRDEEGRRVASGSYFVRMEAGGVRDTRKIALVK
jgi:hypothetical protein